MIDKNRKVAGRTIREWEKLSAELDKDMAGSPENTEPLSAKELRSFRSLLGDDKPKGKRPRRGN